MGVFLKEILKKPEDSTKPTTFLYEMHQHTAGCSACGMDKPEKTVQALHAAGFTGMVLTNHFYHGNTGIKRHQPWEDFVAPYEEAYERAKEVGDELGFHVLFGVEEGVGGGKEVLLYGITPAFLYEHPELQDRGTTEERLERLAGLVHDAGGLLYQAHPFRVRDYINRPHEALPTQYLDGIEAYNACNSDIENARAAAFAQEQGLACIAGSDAHTAKHPRFGVVFDHPIETEAQLVAALQQQNYTLKLSGK